MTNISDIELKIVYILQIKNTHIREDFRIKINNFSDNLTNEKMIDLTNKLKSILEI